MDWKNKGFDELIRLAIVNLRRRFATLYYRWLNLQTTEHLGFNQMQYKETLEREIYDLLTYDEPLPYLQHH